jgi:hypothetical protein
MSEGLECRRAMDFLIHQVAYRDCLENSLRASRAWFLVPLGTAK